MGMLSKRTINCAVRMGCQGREEGTWLEVCRQLNGGLKLGACVGGVVPLVLAGLGRGQVDLLAPHGGVGLVSHHQVEAQVVADALESAFSKQEKLTDRVFRSENLRASSGLLSW